MSRKRAEQGTGKAIFWETVLHLVFKKHKKIIHYRRRKISTLLDFFTSFYGLMFLYENVGILKVCSCREKRSVSETGAGFAASSLGSNSAFAV